MALIAENNPSVYGAVAMPTDCVVEVINNPLPNSIAVNSNTGNIVILPSSILVVGQHIITYRICHPNIICYIL